MPEKKLIEIRIRYWTLNDPKDEFDRVVRYYQVDMDNVSTELLELKEHYKEEAES